MNLRFEQPVWFWLLLALIPAAALGLLWFSSMSPARRVSAIIARLVLYSLIAAMLAGMAWVRKTDRLAVVALVDVSGSVRRYAGDVEMESAPGRRLTAVAAAREFLQRAAEGRGPDDLVGVVAFDGRAAAVAVPTTGKDLDPELDVHLAEGTNIADAIRLGRALIPPDASGRLLLISDGNQTTGDALAAAAEVSAPALAALGASVPIDVVPLRYKLEHEVTVESVDAPPTAAAGAMVNVRVVLNATTASRGTLQLLREGSAVDLNGESPGNGRRIELRPGLNVEVVQVLLDSGRVHRFRAVYEPDVVATGNGGTALAGDTTTENNRAEAFTITPGKGAVLLVDGSAATGGDSTGATLAASLRNSGLEVVVSGPEALPQDLLSLQAYDVVLLQNVPAEAVPVQAQETLVAYVRDLGGGLVMIGGPASFGAGGWKGSPIEPILPVALDIPDKLVTPEIAIVFVLDNSGSMREPVLGTTKSQQQIANESAAMAIRTLDRRDLVGVITFNTNAELLWPLQRNTNTTALTEAVEDISPGGGTNMVPGLELARAQLRNSQAKVKHVVALTDGKSRGNEVAISLAEQMKAEGIKVSTIAVGDDADIRTLQTMADHGEGVFYHAISASQLPRIFLKAVRLVRTPLIRETPFEPVILPTGSPMVAGLDDPPPLNGLTLTQPRPEPTIVNAIMTPTNEPVLAHWQVGLGQVVAFTSDTWKWAQPWLPWDGYEKMWAQVVRQTSRPQGSRNFQATTRTDGEMLRLRLEANDESGRPMERLDVPATVYAPSGASRQVRLVQTGPGTYEADVPAAETGSYVALIKPVAREGNSERRLAPVIVGSTVQEGSEFRARESNDALLAAIASTSGGRVIELAAAERAELFDRAQTRPREAVTPIWRTLLIWCIGVFLLDVATRRVAWDRWLSRRFRPELSAEAAAERERAHAAERTVSALKSRVGVDGAAGATPAIALSEQDARDLAVAARDRRRAQRLAGLSAQAPGGAVETGAGGATSQPPSKPMKEPETGLLAAKRRATERFEDD
ncbi:MAG TPA: VWA domain-containing protein [Phycisphaerales bacterium]|nr:VWA domain-containing protein [Phycisphaerales bacterium]